MNIRNFLNYAFVWIPLFFSGFWLGQTMITLFKTKNIFGSTSLFVFGNIHNLTVISVCILYPVLFLLFNTYLTEPVRMMTTVVFISVGLHFNGIIWSTLNLFIGSRTGIPQLNFAAFFLTCVILYALHRKYSVVQVNKRLLLILVPLFIISVVLFVQSGFFHNWALCEQGLAPDPHNWQWGLEQFLGVWVWVGLARQ